MTRHVPSITVVIASKPWWDSLTDDARQQIDRALAPVEQWRKEMRADEDRFLTAYVERGITVHELSDAQRAAWVEAAWKSHAPLLADIGGEAQDLYDAIVAGKKQFAAQRK